jgi:hypothetical protein
MINKFNDVYKPHNTLIKYKIIPIIPYILSDSTFTRISNKEIYNIPQNMMDYLIQTRTKIHNIESAIESAPHNKLVSNLKDINGNLRNNLIYFQFKAADKVSVPVWLYSGDVNVVKRYDNTISASENHISVKNNCPNNNNDCPEGLYKYLRYTYKGKPFYRLLNHTFKHFYDLPTTLVLLSGNTTRLKEIVDE